MIKREFQQKTFRLKNKIKLPIGRNQIMRLIKRQNIADAITATLQ